MITPGFVNTHHHLYQTLTRARAQDADLFTWLRTLYPVWARIDDEMLYAAARTGLAELALSGCTTVFDHHYVFPRGVSGLIEAELRAASELGVRIVASRGSMDLGVSDGGLPPDNLVEQIDDVLADTERLAGIADGAMTQIVVAPCSPFSVTTRLMEESAALARRLGLGLHTHLAETVEEEAYCRELFDCTPVEYLERVGWLEGDVWCAHCIHLSQPEIERFGAHGVGVAHCPTSNLRLGAGVAPVRELPRRRREGRARRRRLRVERAQRPLLRGEAGAPRRPRTRRARGDERPRGACSSQHEAARARSGGPTSARSSRASAPTSRSGAPTGSSSAAPPIPSAGSCSPGPTGSTG